MHETTAQRLRLLMYQRGLRQVDLLNLCKPYCKKYNVTLNKSHLSQYLSGKFSPKQDKLSVLALALGVSEAWLMGYDVEQKRGSPETSQEEQEILEYYRGLNDRGKEMVIEFIRMASKNDDYRN